MHLILPEKNEKSYGKRTEKDKESLAEKLFKRWYAESFNVNFPRHFYPKIVHFSVQQILETAIVVYIILSVVRLKKSIHIKIFSNVGSLFYVKSEHVIKATSSFGCNIATVTFWKKDKIGLF